MASTPLHGEGRLDINLHIVVSVLPWVREYRPQPLRLEIEVGGKRSFYIPDGRLLGLQRPLCIEVKPLVKLRESPDLDGRKAAIEHALDMIGEDFVIWTERDIEAEPMFSNAKLVWSNAQNTGSTEVVAACETLRHRALSTLAGIVDLLGGGHEGWRMALALIGLKVLAVDLTNEIGPDTQVRLGTRGYI